MTSDAIAIIPARGGSKRIPRKNIKSFFGKPMIAWSIEAAKKSGLFSHIVVSTDDEEIAEVAREWGAEVPFMRPENLSDDFSGTTEVIAHASQWVINQGWSVSAVCCIYATAPFIQEEDIQEGFAKLNINKWDYVISVTNYASSVYRAFVEREEGGVEMLFPENFLTRSQDLPLALHDAAQFYWGRPSSWIEGKPGLSRTTGTVMIPRWRVQDIDDADDWLRAELLAPSIHKLVGKVGAL